MFKKIVVLLIIFSIYSCKQSSKEKTENLENLKGQIVELKEEFPFAVSRIFYRKETLILNSQGGLGYFFRVLDLKTRKFTTKFGKKGRGPNEMTFPFHIHYQTDNDLFTMNDSNSRQFFRIKGDSIGAINSYHSLSWTLVKEAFYPSNIIPINDSLYVASGSFEKGRFALLDSLMNPIKYFGEYPENPNEEQGIPNFYRDQGYQVRFVSEYNSSLLIVSTSFSDMIDVFRIRKDLSIIKEGNYSQGVLPILKSRRVSSTWMIVYKGRQSIIGNQEITTHKNKIYVAYNSDTFGDLLLDNTLIYADELRVFDLKAKLLKQYRLNYPIWAMTISTDGRILYGITIDKETALQKLVEFELPQIKKRK